MSNNNLQWFKFRLIRIIGLCVAFGIAIVIAVCYWIITTNRQQRIQEFKNQVTITNDLLQSGLSAQITMIANNPEFANYLFANSIDRQKHKSDVFLLLKHLDADFIQGIEVIRHNPYSLNKQVVYAQGIKTLYYTNLEMCYLNNNKLSRLVGDCVMRHFTLILYFDPSLYLAKLHQLNHDIHLSSSNKDLSFRFNPIAQTHFAELKIESSSSLSIPIHISWDNELEKLILLIILVVLAICIIFYVISYKIVSNLIVHKITQPLRNMINAVNDNQHLPVSSENLSELNQLIEVVNLYQDTQLKLKLSETYKRVIHDIRSPLFAINVSLNDVLDSNHPSRKTINDAIQNTLTILDNALIATNNIAPQFNIIDSHKVYISIYDLLKQIVDLKIIEWTKYQNQVNLTLKFDDLDNYWILINPIEFKRHLSNLLNNAFQARRLEQINISLEVTEKNEVITLKIKDNGVGVAEHEMQLIMNGTSLSGGNGIGLKNACAFFSQGVYSFRFSSQKNLGTLITIGINSITSPSWFTDILEIHPFVIIVDNDLNVLDYWHKRLASMQLNIISFNLVNQFLTWFNQRDLNLHYTFIVDYEYAHNDITGIEILNQLNLSHENGYLISHNYDRVKLQHQLEQYPIKVIPKSSINDLTILFTSKY